MVEPFATTWNRDRLPRGRSDGQWGPGVMNGIVPGVSRMMAVALRRVTPLKAMPGGSAFGILRDRVGELPAVRTALGISVWRRR
jgi:hypothetical protein